MGKPEAFLRMLRASDAADIVSWLKWTSSTLMRPLRR